MSVLIAILVLVNLAVSIFFIGAFREKTVRAARDINAIGERVRIAETRLEAWLTAYSLRIKMVEDRLLNTPDTGFTLPLPDSQSHENSRNHSRKVG